MSGKGFVRLTIIAITIYFLFAFVIAQAYGVNIFSSNYVLLLETCIVIYCFSEGKYHCKYMKFMALGITLADAVSRLDYVFNFLTVDAHNLIPISILVTCCGISLYKALKHFHRVRKLRRLQKYGPQTK